MIDDRRCVCVCVEGGLLLVVVVRLRICSINYLNRPPGESPI